MIPGGLHAALDELPLVEESDEVVIGRVPLSSRAVHRFVSEDGKRLVQCGPGLFTANVLGDYGDYENFQRLVRTGFQAFGKVAEPTKILRVGVRYINHIRSELLESLADPLNVTWGFPNDLPNEARVNMRGLFQYERRVSAKKFW